MLKQLPDPIDADLVRRALVTKLRITATSCSRRCSRAQGALPAAEIDALVYAETVLMLEDHPAISRIHAIDRDAKRRGIISHARGGARLALDATRTDTTSWFTLPSIRAAFGSRVCSGRYSVARELERALAMAEKLHPLLPVATVDASSPGRMQSRRLAPHRYSRLGREGAGAGARRCRDLSAHCWAHGVQSRRFVLLHPGSRWLFKCWSAERYAQFADRRRRRVAHCDYRRSDSDERSLVDAIVAQTALPPASPVDLTGLCLRELAAVIREARIFVCRFGIDAHRGCHANTGDAVWSQRRARVGPGVCRTE
jgi:heptosyltransferase-3